MKLSITFFLFFVSLFFSESVKAQADFFRLESQVCDNSETYHCCCYQNGVYLFCRNCPVPSYQIICNFGGIWSCSGLGGCEAGGLNAEECEFCCFPGYAGGGTGSGDHPNQPIPFGMI